MAVFHICIISHKVSLATVYYCILISLMSNVSGSGYSCFSVKWCITVKQVKVDLLFCMLKVLQLHVPSQSVTNQHVHRLVLTRAMALHQLMYCMRLSQTAHYSMGFAGCTYRIINEAVQAVQAQQQLPGE